MAGSTVLLALDDIPAGSVLDAQLARICEHLAADGHDVLRAGTDADALALVQSRADLTAALVSWDARDGDRDASAEAVLKALVGRFTRLPVFLVTTSASVDDLPLWISEVICGYVWLMEDTPGFRAGLLPGDQILKIDGASAEKMWSMRLRVRLMGRSLKLRWLKN